MELETFSIVLYVFCTLFAACLGSFSNVVIYRVPNHKSIVFPPSACPKCGARIKPYDNIPVLSWLILRGRCRHCKAPISPQYPVVETVSGLFGFLLCRQIFAPNLGLLLMEGGFLRLFLFFVAMSIFVVSCLALAIIDIQKTEIPPEIALPVAALGVVASLILPDGAPFGAVRGNLEFLDSFLGAGIGAGLVLLIIGLYYLLTRRIGMGGGDVWMLAMIGAFLGWQSLIFVFLASILQGILAAVIAIFLGRRQQTDSQAGLFRNDVAQELNDAPLPETTGKLAVPYGPFLALAAVEYVFLGHLLPPLWTGEWILVWSAMP